VGRRGGGSTGERHPGVWPHLHFAVHDGHLLHLLQRRWSLNAGFFWDDETLSSAHEVESPKVLGGKGRRVLQPKDCSYGLSLAGKEWRGGGGFHLSWEDYGGGDADDREQEAGALLEGQQRSGS